MANGASRKTWDIPINTIENEGSLIIAADGKTAYYASDRDDSKGGLDIYTFDMREEVRPLRTLWVQGKVFDIKTKDGLPSAVELVDLSTGKALSKVQTDEEGYYLVTLPLGYGLPIQCKQERISFLLGKFSLFPKNTRLHLPDRYSFAAHRNECKHRIEKYLF